MGTLLHFFKRYPWVTATCGVGLVVIALLITAQDRTAAWVAAGYVLIVALITAGRMVRDIICGSFGLDVLALVAMVATVLVGEPFAGLIVVLMLTGGEALEDYAQARSERELSALLERSPDIAHRVGDVQSGGGSCPDQINTDSGTITDIAVSEVQIGDQLIVRPNEVVPVDGVLLSTHGEFDTSSLTGESLPVTRTEGDSLSSGEVNGSSAVRMRATKAASESHFQRVIDLVRESEESRAPSVRLADRIAVPFTLVSLAIAGIAWWVSGDPVRFAEVLVLATPCPLLIAAPVAFLGGMSQASKRGIVVKGGAVLEALARVRTVIFDKTGTLTRGRPELIDLQLREGFDRDTVLLLAAGAEQYSTHALAASIVEAAQDRGLPIERGSHAEEIATFGVQATIRGHVVTVGKAKFIAEITGESLGTLTGFARETVNNVYVAIDREFAGVLYLADAIRDESPKVVSWLRAHGVERVAMLTGDLRKTAGAVAADVGIDIVHAELLPEDKVRLSSQQQHRPVMMVGDGVNDAPVLASADVGVALGATGATAAGEAAHAVILRDSLAPVVDAVVIGRHTLRVAKTAIWIGVALSLTLMLIATTGVIPAVIGALLQEAVDLAAILYALRALKAPKGLTWRTN